MPALDVKSSNLPPARVEIRLKHCLHLFGHIFGDNGSYASVIAVSFQQSLSPVVKKPCLQHAEATAFTMTSAIIIQHEALQQYLDMHRITE